MTAFAKETIARFCIYSILIFATPTRAQLLTENVIIRVSDGIRLEATIGRPIGLPPTGGFPAVVLIHGYGGSKGEMSQLMQLVAAYGYASLAYSVRGQGGSEGFSTTMGERERQDLVEVVNFLRNATNINPNKLGVTGGSQGGIHSWMAAIYRMPGVLAVAPLIATPNFARDLVPNNCVSRWLVYELTLGSVRFGSERDRIKNFIVQDLFDSVLAYIDTRNLAHLVDSIRIPVFQAVGWADALFPVNANIAARQRLVNRNIPAWSYFGTNGHAEPVSATEAAYVLQQTVYWFDHWLKGFSLPDVEFPMVFYADDRPDWPRRSVREFLPQPNTRQRFYIGSSELSGTPPRTNATHQFSLQYTSTYTPQMGWEDKYSGARFLNAFQQTSVRLMTDPFVHEIEITGIPKARLFVSSAEQKFQAHVRLFDVTQNGSSYEWRLISRGNFGVRNNAPNTTHQLDYDLKALSHIVPAGHRIGIEVTSLDMFSSDVAQIAPFFGSTTSQLLSTNTAPSFIEIPLIGSSATTVYERSPALPTGFVLHQNYPNPFNPSTIIRFAVRGSRKASLRVFDALGREVAVLINGELQSGEYSIPFSGADLSSGEYFYRLEVGESSAVRKMLLIR